MRNKKLPSKKQWKRIVNNAFSSGKKHDFSVLYELRKSEIQKGHTPQRETNYFHRRYISMIAAAAAVIIAVPAVVFAYTNQNTEIEPASEIEKMTQALTTSLVTEEVTTEAVTEQATIAEVIEEHSPNFQITQNGKYQYILKYTPSYDEIADTQTYDVQYTWLPEGVYALENEKNAYVTPSGGTFEAAYYRIKDDTAFKETLSGIVSYSDVSDESKTAYIFNTSDIFEEIEDVNNFNKIAWVKFKGFNFFVQLYATNDISTADFKSFIKGMTLIPSNDEKAYPWVNSEKSSDNSKISAEAYHSEMLKNCKPIDEVSFTNVGQTISHTVNGHNVDITIDNAWIQDDFEGITTDCCGIYKDYSPFIDEEGKIYQTYCWMKYGDGKDTIDELVEKENAEMKLIVLELTYTNTSDHDIFDDIENHTSTDFLVAPEVYHDCEGVLDLYDDVYKNGLAGIIPTHISSGNGFVSFETDNHSAKNHINIPQGEQTHVKISLLARADMLDDYYINIFGSYSDKNNETPYLAVKDIPR
ncbi:MULTISPECIES: hypothetical protein [Ruminococcus]|uniref:DUF4367 domain-containing protein n=1 Tax=Ruminococcus flavefaciens TaxID=1265 RepID=A0A1M7H6K4_RUMFL|nr:MULTISPECIES: hypothetical protein [Ruminococcus]MCR4795251.1 hypothetical protein [Ruminococcus sp.]SHM24028.1 hypothetical protein SAMN04487860_102146 [Ruminococcus flavefaciens]